jgi:hypothetical protein
MEAWYGMISSLRATTKKIWKDVYEQKRSRWGHAAIPLSSSGIYKSLKSSRGSREMRKIVKRKSENDQYCFKVYLSCFSKSEMLSLAKQSTSGALQFVSPNVLFGSRTASLPCSHPWPIIGRLLPIARSSLARQLIEYSAAVQLSSEFALCRLCTKCYSYNVTNLDFIGLSEIGADPNAKTTMDWHRWCIPVLLRVRLNICWAGHHGR